MIKLILFDMGGVLCFDKRDDYLKKYTSLTGLDLKTLHKRCFPGTWHLLDKGLISFTVAWNRIKKRIPKYSLLPKDFHKVGFEVFEDKRITTLVRQLKKTHRVGMLSNMSLPLHNQLKKQRMPFHLYKPLFLSYKMKMRKPEKQIYRTIMDATGLKGSEILFIDDKSRNTIVAKKFGWKTIVYKNPTQLKKDLQKYL